MHSVRLTLFLAILMVFSNECSAAAETIYTANEKDRSLSALSWPDKEKSFSVQLPAIPHNVDISYEKEYVLVTAMGHSHDSSGSLFVYGRKNMPNGPIARIAVGKHPAHVVSGGYIGEIAYVTLSGENAVALVNLDKLKVEEKIPVGKHPHGLRLSLDKKILYVANMGENTISIVDTQKKQEVKKIIVGPKPVQVATTPDSALLYATINETDKVAVIDTKRKTVIAEVKVKNGPVQSIMAQGKLFVANQGSREDPGNQVSVIDSKTQQLIGNIQTGNGPHGVAASSDQKNVFVTNLYQGTVTIIDVASLKAVDEIRTGQEPNGIASVDWK